MSLVDLSNWLVERFRCALRTETCPGHGDERLRRFLALEVWPQVPDDALGVPISRSEREAILGYGPEGV